MLSFLNHEWMITSEGPRAKRIFGKKHLCFSTGGTRFGKADAMGANTDTVDGRVAGIREEKKRRKGENR
jgi:hypothetical protein